MLDNQDMKTILSETLAKEMRENPDIVLIGADLMGANGTWPLHKEFPERVINVGIAEANMVGAAAGLAAGGKLPVCDTFASFMARRDFDQIFISVAYAGLNVKFIGSDPGIAAEMNGGTHMAFEDVALMRTVPGMTVYEPCDCTQLRKSIHEMLYSKGPVYLRLFRKKPHKIYDDDYQFTFGKADLLSEGNDATIIACGLMVWNALQAAEALKEEGIRVRVLNMHTIKPIDQDSVIRAAKETGAIVTAENANYINGLGSAVAEIIAENDLCVPFRRVGVKDQFGEVGTSAYLAERFHLTAADIADAVKETISRK